MSRTVLVRGARQLITLHAPREPRRGPALKELGIIRDGALLMEDGRIVEVGPSRRVENLAQSRNAHEIDATGRVVMPGFVDCHTHLVSGVPWLNESDAPADGIEHQPGTFGLAIRPVRYSSTSRLEARARQVVDGMIRHGTTTLEAQSGSGVDETGELKILRVLAKLHRAPLDVVPTFLNPQAIPLSRTCSELMPKIHRRGLARFAAFRCDEHVFNMEQANRYLEAARGLGFRLKVHTGEGRQNLGVGLAVAQEAISADHLDYLDRSDVELLARSNTMAVLLPGAAFHAGCSRYAPARQLIDAGAAVALATDFNPSTSPTYSMQMIVALACAQMRMTPEEAICAATFNAACAIGCEQRVGSLEAGKSADLIILNASDYREIPYHFGVNLVRMTVKRGETVYQEGNIGARPEDVPPGPAHRDLRLS
jgi:imidazolonepropionase